MFDYVLGFDWDIGNYEKCQKHGVSIEDIDFIFRNNPKIAPDNKHSSTEKRFIAIGINENGRHAFIAFTFRKIDGEKYIRPISARFMHEKEVINYEKYSEL
jgi:uncharacterized protein